MINIRPIQPSDNEAIAAIVRKVMTEFNADPRTTVLGDPTLNTMYENYQQPNAFYFVVENNGEIIGGCGLKQLDGCEESICELQRMFLLSESRGTGIGKQLIQRCIEKARQFNYKKMYLESLAQMHSAIGLYEKSGFKRIEKSLGNTGHGGCDIFMVSDL